MKHYRGATGATDAGLRGLEEQVEDAVAEVFLDAELALTLRVIEGRPDFQGCAPCWCRQPC